MSLEDALKANTEAVLALTKALNAAALTTVSGNGNAVAEAVAAIDKAAGKNKGAAATETKAAEPEKAAAPAAAERPADVPQAITYDTLKRPFLDLVKVHGAPKVLAMLAPVGVQNSLKEIENEPSKWADALAILQRELAAVA